MTHINFYQNKYPTTKIKAKALKQLKALKDNEIIDDKLYYYLKPADLPPPRFYSQPKYISQEFLYVLYVPISSYMFHKAAFQCTVLTKHS